MVRVMSYAVQLRYNYLLRRTALLMEKEPTNMQAISLGQLIDKGVARGMCSPSSKPSHSLPLRGLHRDGIGRRSSSHRYTSCGWSHTASNPQMNARGIYADALLVYLLLRRK
jgi:hypothetical protein